MAVGNIFAAVTRVSAAVAPRAAQATSLLKAASRNPHAAQAVAMLKATARNPERVTMAIGAAHATVQTGGAVKNAVKAARAGEVKGSIGVGGHSANIFMHANNALEIASAAPGAGTILAIPRGVVTGGEVLSHVVLRGDVETGLKVLGARGTNTLIGAVPGGSLGNAAVQVTTGSDVGTKVFGEIKSVEVHNAPSVPTGAGPTGKQRS